MKVLKGSYIGNIKWLVPEESLVWAEKDLNLCVPRNIREEIIIEAKKIKPTEIMSDREFLTNNIILDGGSTELHFSNWFENDKSLDLDFSNPWIDMEERNLIQYNKVIDLIEKAVKY